MVIPTGTCPHIRWNKVYGRVRLQARQADSPRQREQQPLVPGRGPRAGAAAAVLRLYGPTGRGQEV